ncbi:CcmD family protein [Candidatus Viridilinea mediisalina]|uniref:CcmD family protein n=1 Tax=Candidatus Viridilinea mediisalina TaxID=2024553 RepID=A0A2A6RIP8_9CHLR|nr:CcmD family protein [Candidatus Viridilinea mediisalina]PDW02759.1 hypothetical protein CJ255_12375 [Candidatus Viridilinea mediisalina]
MIPNAALEAGVAIYVALAVALSVWLAIFIYLWRIDALARRLKQSLEQQQQQEDHERPAVPKARVTRVQAAEEETVER